MRRAKHLLLWSSIGVLVLLATAAVEENFKKEWRRLQRSAGERASSPLPVKLRQIVAPSLDAADRCVSCHVGMAPGESATAGDPVLGPHPDVVHDPAQWGCTICHGGQGRATERADAHGEVPHWPEPMIRLAHAEAGCGSCHAHTGIPDLGQLARGLRAIERNDCLACHRLDGRGGTLRPGGAGGMEGPDLSRAGALGYDRAWYAKHIERRDEAEPWLPSMTPIPVEHRRLIDLYLDSRVGAPALVEAKAVFHALGCRGCHRVAGVGGDEGPDLTHAGQLDPGLLDMSRVPGEPTVANWHAAHLRAPAAVVPGSLMPEQGLPEEDIDRLVTYLLSLRRQDVPGELWPEDRLRSERLGEREFATDGASLYHTFCSACHGPGGQGMRYPGTTPFPAIANPDYLALATDGFIATTIRRGRPGRRMPAWSEAEGGLRAEEIERVTAYVRELGGGVRAERDDRPRHWVSSDPEPGARLYAAHCAGCHGARGEGGEGPALANPVLLESATDTYLVETIRRGRRGTSMVGFGTSSPVRPRLSPGEVSSIVAFIRTWSSDQGKAGHDTARHDEAGDETSG